MICTIFAESSKVQIMVLTTMYNKIIEGTITIKEA